jgi:hypothetical protein
MMENNTCIKFHPKKEGWLLVGKLEGLILMVDIIQKKVTKRFDNAMTKERPISDIFYSPGEDVLAAFVGVS